MLCLCYYYLRNTIAEWVNQVDLRSLIGSFWFIQ